MLCVLLESLEGLIHKESRLLSLSNLLLLMMIPFNWTINCLVTGCAGPVSDQGLAAGNLGWAGGWRSEPCECLDTTEPWLTLITGTTSPRLVLPGLGLDTTCVDQIECILPFPPSHHTQPPARLATLHMNTAARHRSLTWLAAHAHKKSD